ncbi:rCG54353 [Rattus norvegicus]|uniref:RCG54353 n=1 Tax=Rattus norvegicus TaxID=10116 RepID=A6J968_RAT|nr:rCG54353 [Rattus norvegicus]
MAETPKALSELRAVASKWLEENIIYI